jgi:hypothetical protein
VADPGAAANESLDARSSNVARFITVLIFFLVGTVATIGWSCSRSTLQDRPYAVGLNGRFTFKGYLPSVLPSGYSLIRQKPWLRTMQAQGQGIIVGANHPDGSFDQITTVEEFLGSKKERWWLRIGEHDLSTYTERVVKGFPAVVQEEFETSKKKKRLRTSIWLDVPECENHIRAESPGTLEPEAVIATVGEIGCRGRELLVIPGTGREVLMTSRLSNARGPALIFDNENHSGRFEFSVTYRTMPKALAEEMARLTPTRSSLEEAAPKQFAGHSTIIAPRSDGSSTSYKWQEGTVSFELVTIDAAEEHAQAFIEAIRPVEQEAFLEIFKTLSSERPPRLQSYVPEPAADTEPVNTEPEDTTQAFITQPRG